MTQAEPLRDADVRRHQRFLEALARNLGGDEDAVQDTWLRVLQRGGARRVTGGASKGWLASVLRSSTIDRHPRNRRRPRRDAWGARSEALPDSLQPLLEAEASMELRAALGKLPKDECEVLQLRYLEQMSPREIARRRELPVENVYRQLERGRDRLRGELGEEPRFRGMALAPFLALKRAGWIAAASLSWKPLALLAVIALVGGTWRTIGGPPSDAAPVLPLVVNSDESKAPVNESLGVVGAAPQSHPVRAPLVGSEMAPGEAQARLQTASLELTVILDSETDAGGIQAHFTGHPGPRMPRGGDIEIGLPRSGRVTVELTANCEYELTLRSPLEKGLEPMVIRRIASLDPGQVRALTVEIPGAGLRGFTATVVHEGSRSPVTAAQVIAQDDGRMLARSDASGRVRFDVPREGLGVVRIQAEGYGPVLIDTENEGRAEQADFVIGLEPAASLLVRGWTELEPAAGQVRDGEAHIEAQVFCQADDIARPLGSRLGVERWHRTTEPKGAELSFAALPTGVPLSLEIRRGEALLHRSLQPLLLEPGEQRVLSLARDPQRYLVGRLQRPSGEGLAGREIWLLEASDDDVDPWRLLDEKDEHLCRASTDAQGAFEFPGVPEGRWWLGPAPGQEDLAPYARLHVQDATLETRVDLEAIPIYRVGGRVQVPHGSETRAQVFAYHPEVDESVRAQSSGSRFEIGPLLPGRWRLHATLGLFQVSRFVYVDVPAATGTGAEVELVFDDALDIAGHVVDGETEAPESAHVSLVRSGSLSMTTGPEGRFRFEGRKPGTYTLCAQTQDGRVGFLPNVELGAKSLEDLVLTVFPSARLQLAVQGEGPAPRCRILAGGDLYQDFTLHRGVATLQAVPATSIEVIIYSHHDGQRVVHARRSVLTTPGTTEPMNFVID